MSMLKLFFWKFLSILEYTLEICCDNMCWCVLISFIKCSFVTFPLFLFLQVVLVVLAIFVDRVLTKFGGNGPW